MKAHSDIEQTQEHGVLTAGTMDLGHTLVLGTTQAGTARLAEKIISNCNTLIVMRVKENELDPQSAQDGSA
jgi:hypothetical protein